jgi:hypothetical protein
MGRGDDKKGMYVGWIGREGDMRRMGRADEIKGM